MTSSRFSDFRSVIEFILGFITPLLAIISTLAVLAFFWGLLNFIRGSGDPKNHAEGRQFMIWSVVALFCMVSVWGIVSFLQKQIGINNTLVIPTLPTGSGR